MDDKNQETESSSTYAVVNIEHKKKKAAERDVKRNENMSLYAAVDKTKKMQAPVEVKYNDNKDGEVLERLTTENKNQMSNTFEAQCKDKSSQKVKVTALVMLIILWVLLSFVLVILTGVSYAMILNLRSESASNKQLLISVQMKLEQLHNTTKNPASKYVNQTNPLTSTDASLGRNKSSPATSCRNIYLSQPSSSSGYYWVTSSNGTSVEVYCEMTKSCGNITGGLTRIALVNNKTISKVCPGVVKNAQNYNQCGSIRRCKHIVFSLNKILYSHICGVLEGDFTGTPEGFTGTSTTINDNYVDGISLTYGTASNKTHVWTFIGDEEPGMPLCPHLVPEFVEDHYSCLTWNQTCTNAMLCSHKFFRHLQHSVAQDIELRLCQDEGPNREQIFLRYSEIYVL